MGQAAARVARAIGAFVETQRSGARPGEVETQRSGPGEEDGRLPVRIRAWDGSEAGAPADSGAPVVVLNHRRALRRLLWQPGEMGLAHAYVSGDLDVDGDLGAGLAAMWGLFRDGAVTTRRPRLGELPGLVGTAVRLGLLGPKPSPPPEAITLPRFARLHSKRRDRAVIAHHYDAGNDFYELILDENMAYSSGYWTDLAAPPTDANLVAAQDAKLDMICRKLGLGPGSTLLDVGCGWGSLPIHAAKHFGAHVRGVTIATEQRDHINQRVRAEGLADKVQVDLVDYRDIPTHIEEYGSFDAVSSIEMGEHVGDGNYPTFAAVLFGA
ncbi:MAG: cyclopropane-fatty-acyl-phospholipid synthase, partial [Actinomycetota bacterium]|nr:cyclopropane-fatty-acyl-phospholipid synthase [Actinomycetota bacterium]